MKECGIRNQGVLKLYNKGDCPTGGRLCGEGPPTIHARQPSHLEYQELGAAAAIAGATQSKGTADGCIQYHRRRPQIQKTETLATSICEWRG